MLVTADVAKAVFAVVTEPNRVVKEPLDELAVTVPEMGSGLLKERASPLRFANSIFMQALPLS